MAGEIISNINLLSGIILAVGLALITAEFLIPGFGIFGVSGIILLITFVVLVAKTPMQIVMLTLFLFCVLAVIFLIIVTFVSKKKLPRCIRLDDSIESDEKVGGVEAAPCEGDRGTAVTALRPCGRAELGGIPVEVISESEFIEAGADIKVISVSENGQITVRRAN